MTFAKFETCYNFTKYLIQVWLYFCFSDCDIREVLLYRMKELLPFCPKIYYTQLHPTKVFIYSRSVLCTYIFIFYRRYL